MHITLAIGEIKQRAEAIGHTLSSIASLAGLAPSTVLRLNKAETDGRGYGGRSKTRERLVAALQAEEARVRGHLKTLEPTEAGEGRDAA